MSLCRTIRNNAVEVEFPHGFEFLFRPSRYKVAYGGRGSGKSWSFAKVLILMALKQKLRILCCREFQLSISESVHRLIADQIAAMGLERYFTVQQQGVYGVNGSEFIFLGVRNNPTKLKSTEGVNVVWIEEGQTISDESWRIIIPTIREEGSEIWISMNPDLADDPSYRRFVLSPPPDCVSVRVNWDSNPWFPPELRREKNYLYRVDPEAAANIWGGACRQSSNAQIFKGKFEVAAFEPVTDGEQRWEEVFGIDWGFSQDPSVLIKAWVANEGRTLFIEHEVYRVGLELDDTGPAFLAVPGASEHVIRADSARPESISFVRNHSGLRIVPAEKWKNSVLDGIAWLRSRERIIIHPRCRHTVEEFRLYSYKVDKLTGDILPDVVDKHNHCIDSLRYGLQEQIMSTTTLGCGLGFENFRRGGAEKWTNSRVTELVPSTLRIFSSKSG